MRIATSTLFNSSINNMNAADTNIATLEQEISTGKMVNTPADNPVAAAEQVTINQQIARNTDLTSNRTTAEASLNTVSTTLASVNTLLTNVKSEIVQAGDGAYGTSERQTLASQLQGQLQDLLGYANAQDGNGEYLFSGFQTQTQPFAVGNFVGATAAANNTGSGALTPANQALAGAFPGNGTVTITSYTPPSTPGGTASFTYNVSGLPSADNVTGATSTNGQLTVAGATLSLTGTPVAGDTFTLGPQSTQYQGDAGLRQVQVAEGQDMAINVPGSTLFNSVPTGNGTFATSASTANTGSGTISQGTVISAALLTKDNYAITFTGSGAVTAANSNAGTVSLVSGSLSGSPTNADQYELSFSTASGAPTYSVTDNTTGTVVSSNQPYTSGAAISANGLTFKLAGAPANGDNFTIAPGAGTQFNVVDTTTNQPVLSNQTYSSGNAIQFAGMSFNISGTPSAGDQFQVTPSTSTSVFQVIQQAIDALNSATSTGGGNTQLANALASANAGIDASMNQVGIAQTTVGGRQQQLTQLDSSSAQLKINYQQKLSTLVNTDMTAAISNLDQQQISLEAAQKSFVTVEGLSLFNYIQ